MDKIETLSGKKVLVTGGAGFIGSNIIESLLRNGLQVVCLDNLVNGNRRNIEPFLTNDRFTFLEADILDFDSCLQACDGVEVVMHQAAIGSVPRSVENPIPTHEANSTGYINMLHAAVKQDVKRFVYASSSSVYGDHPGLPKVEEATGTLLSPYAVSKYSNELYAKVFGKLYGLETIGLRYFNVFGKNQDPSGAYAAVIPKFVKAMLNGDTVTIHGDGLQSRDFTYIANVVQANICAAVTDNPEAYNRVYNVAFGAHITLMELVDILKEKVKQVSPNSPEVNIEHIPTRKGDIKHSFADVTRAKKWLDYNPTHSVDQGLNETISWYYDFFTKESEVGT